MTLLLPVEKHVRTYLHTQMLFDFIAKGKSLCKDIRCKMNHILLSAAKGKPEEVAEMVQSWPHDVSWWEGRMG